MATSSDLTIPVNCAETTLILIGQDGFGHGKAGALEVYLVGPSAEKSQYPQFPNHAVFHSPRGFVTWLQRFFVEGRDFEVVRGQLCDNDVREVTIRQWRSADAPVMRTVRGSNFFERLGVNRTIHVEDPLEVDHFSWKVDPAYARREGSVAREMTFLEGPRRRKVPSVLAA